MNTVTLSYTENNAFVKSALQMLRNSEYFNVSRVKSDNSVQNGDIWKNIPEEFRCDPFEISPSGDPYWADKRNVDEIKRRSDEVKSGKAEFITFDELKSKYAL